MTIQLSLPPIKEQNNEQGRRKAIRIFTEPVYIRKLVDFYKNKEIVAKKMGVSRSAISSAINNKNATLVMDKAALGVYMYEVAPHIEGQKEIENNGKIFVSLFIDKNVFKQLIPWLKGSGVTYKAFAGE